jgi:hypothetical protein
MDKRDVQKYYERQLQRRMILGIKGYPWYILSHSKHIIFVLEATKISQGYLNLKMGISQNGDKSKWG